MVAEAFRILFPLFFLILGGYVMNLVFRISEETLVRIITDFFMPLLIIASLAGSDININTVGKLAGATSMVVGVLLVLSLLYCRIFGSDRRSFVPPVIFMNSGFLGIPLMELWGGNQPMSLIIVYDQIQTFFIFTLGIVIVTGSMSKRGLKEIALSPILWAIVVGFLLRFLGINLPSVIQSAFEFGGRVAPPLAAFALGVSLYGKRIVPDRDLAAAIILRMVIGFGAGLAAVLLFRIEGITATVVVVASSLPAAVFSYVLPARYGVDSPHPGMAVLLTTVVGVVTIPLSFRLAESILAAIL
ncbi:MAG: AEC family transporter [Spirochaetales bacterium]|nr:AEC family transporter [Spirochaetales bacterium]MCF7938096.1 AEC family transporter [Spirochaetales bacterium]